MVDRATTNPDADPVARLPDHALLVAAAQVTRHVERAQVDMEFVSAIVRLWRCNDVELYQLGEGRTCRRIIAVHDGGVVLHERLVPGQEQPVASVTGAEDALAHKAAVLLTEAPEAILTMPVFNAQKQIVRLLRLGAPEASLRAAQSAIEALLRLYQNHLNLIDDSERDALTGLRNRRTFDHLLVNLLAGEQTAGTPSAGFRRTPAAAANGENYLAVLDIDNFKSINDRYGHLFGDEVLILVANLMQTCFRAGDPLFRFGGEEFVIVLCGVDRSGAGSAVDRFRRSLENQVFPQVGRITISAGFTEIDEGQPSSAILNRADAALYYAKEHGRNRTCCYETLVDQQMISPLILASGGSDGFGIELF